MGCIQRQLAALLEVPIGDIEYEFTLLRPGWEEKRGDAILLLAYCAKARMSCYLFWADRLIQRVACPNACMCVLCSYLGRSLLFLQKDLESDRYLQTKKGEKKIARVPQALPEWRLKSAMSPSKGELVTVPNVAIDSVAPGGD